MARELASRFVQALTSGSINDISYDQMNRIIRKLQRMAPAERHTGVKVGKVLVDELGVKKANEYVEKALAQGLVSIKEYDELKAALTLYTPREKLPPSWAGRGRQELLVTQKRLRSDAEQLSNAGKEVIKMPMRALEKDLDRLRKVWGIR